MIKNKTLKIKIKKWIVNNKIKAIIFFSQKIIKQIFNQI